MSRGPAVDVSVVVPVFNEASLLADTVETMLAQRYQGSLEFLFVDGASEDGSREILAGFAARDDRVQVLDNPRRFEPSALNIGIEQARGRYVALLNAHCWFPKDYLARGVERLEAGDAAWVTGPAIPLARDWFSHGVARALLSPLGAGGSKKWRAADQAEDGEVELDTGLFAGVVRRTTLEALGRFEEDWVVNHDAEMAGRLLDSGGTIVQLQAMGAYYQPRNSVAGLWRQYFRFGFYRVRTSHKHPVALRRFHVAAGALAMTPPAAVIAPNRYATPARAALLAYAGGLAVAARSADRDGSLRERTAVAIALATMHFAWGTGFICGCLRFGPPVAGLLRLAGRDRGAS